MDAAWYGRSRCDEFRHLLRRSFDLSRQRYPGDRDIQQCREHLCSGDHSAARLQLDREELEWQRANGKLQKEKEFCEWIQRPEVRDEFLPKIKPGLSKETLEKIERELHLL